MNWPGELEGLEVQMTQNLLYEGVYIRVRARMKVAKGLTCLTLKVEGRKWLPVKYENVLFSYKGCVLMRHSHEECNDGV